MKRFILGVASLLLLTGNINAATIGYSQSTVKRTNIFRLGSSTTQGQAIRLSKGKLQMLKGKTVNSATFIVGSKQTTGNKLNVFITTSLTGTPVAQGTVTIKKSFDKCVWTLDTPYTITGDEDQLYIGYTAEIPVSYKLLLSDGSYDIDGCNFAYNDGEWVSTYGMNRGSAYITFDVDGDVDYTDIIMGRTNFSGYYKAGNQYDFSARFVNAGTKPVTSFDAIVTVAGKTTSKHFESLNIASKAGYSFKLDGLDADQPGYKDISIKINNVNGNNEDIDPSDNELSSSVFFYPNNMERSLLLEGFTGQTCPNCPTGHLNVHQAIENSDESIIEVSHHAGYYADMFTMLEDDAYRFYYSNPISTYAPAVMVNRSAEASQSLAPVIASTDYSPIPLLINKATELKPYVSLQLASDLDQQTRDLKVKLSILPHEKITADSVLFNVFLIQDSIIAYQYNGGQNYVHNSVFRGTVTGNSWGIIAEDLAQGKVVSWEKTINIPESIFSSYWDDDLLEQAGTYTKEQVNVKTDLKNMYLVAFVAEYNSSDNTKNVVYNCCKTKLGDTYTQKAFDVTADIQNVDKKQDVAISVNNGKINVAGDYDKLYVYNIAGRMVNADANLSKGVYIIKVVANGKQTTKKVFVR